MKPRVYTDTSVLGGCEDDEFREPSRRLLEAFVGGELTLVLSELTLRELELPRQSGIPFSRFERRGRFQAMSTSSKTFDCVQSMRQTRDGLSAEIVWMSYDELAQWLREHQYADPSLQRLAEKAAQQADAADRLSAGH